MNKSIGFVVALIAVLFIGIGVTNGYFYYQEDTHVACVVNDKDRVNASSGGSNESEARVYTENCGTFVVGDSLIKGQFDSADTFGSIKNGETYDFTSIGYRIPFLSVFPNIIEVNE